MPVIYGPPKKRRGNSLITRGLGRNPTIITQGYVAIIKEVALKIIKVGQSGTKRAQQFVDDVKEVAVWAKLLKINDEPIEETIQGLSRKNVNSGAGVAIKTANLISAGVVKGLSNIKFTIKRLK